MQGISNARHKHLTDALLQLEDLLNTECGCLQQAAEYRQQLEAMHRNYERLLDELARQIAAYEDLYSQVKVQFLSRKLKELKREIPSGMPAFAMLTENIRTAYGI